jgi:hypothetical protein
MLTIPFDYGPANRMNNRLQSSDKSDVQVKGVEGGKAPPCCPDENIISPREHP